MKKDQTDNVLSFFNLLSIIFCVLFFLIGWLNIFLVGVLPGFLYLSLSLLYIPSANTVFQQKFGFSIPPAVKIFLGFVILWGTLAVGDLAEVLGLLWREKHMVQ